MEKINIKNLLVNKNFSIKEAMKIIDAGRLGIAFVVDNKKRIFGVVTDGDIRGAILDGINIKKSIKEITNTNPIIIEKPSSNGRVYPYQLRKLKNQLSSPEEIEAAMPRSGSLKVPVVCEGSLIKGIIFIDDYKKNKFLTIKREPKLNQRGIKKVLLVGGAGYLGSVLSRKLLNKGYKVKVLDNLTYGDHGIKDLYKDKNFDFLKGDI